MHEKNDLDAPLLDLSSGVHPNHRDLTRHIVVIGTLRSGKSPGPGVRIECGGGRLEPCAG